MNKIGAAIAPCYQRVARTSIAGSVASSYATCSISNDRYFVSRKYATNNNNSSESSDSSKGKRGRRVWRAILDADDEWSNILNNKNDSIAYLTADGKSSAVEVKHWEMAVDDVDDRRLVDESLSRICEQVRKIFMKLQHYIVSFVVVQALSNNHFICSLA